MVNWTPRNNIQWNLNQKQNAFHKKIIKIPGFENLVYEMAAILSHPETSCIAVLS